MQDTSFILFGKRFLGKMYRSKKKRLHICRFRKDDEFSIFVLSDTELTCNSLKIHMSSFKSEVVYFFFFHQVLIQEIFVIISKSVGSKLEVIVNNH